MVRLFGRWPLSAYGNQTSNQSMKPAAPLRCNFRVFALLLYFSVVAVSNAQSDGKLPAEEGFISRGLIAFASFIVSWVPERTSSSSSMVDQA